MQESDYGRIAFFSDGNVYGMIVGERLAKLQSKKKTTKASSRTLSRGYWNYHR